MLPMPPPLPPQLLQGLIIILVILPFLAFWAWMFTEMRANRDLPDNVKSNWSIAFIIFNIFAAVLYYNLVHRNRS
jgi:hypothetical protein